MGIWHGYLGIENVGLNAAQKQLLVIELRKLGPKTHPQPAMLNHLRTRLDGDAVIFEAEFDENKITVASIKQYLADVFGIDPSTITHTTQSTQYGPMVTFSRGTDKLRMLLFGGIGSNWDESRLNALAYLKVDADRWEDVSVLP